jgi:hypothetical protein
VARAVEADYLVVGAGAMGMAFVDALVARRPDARVVVIDRRDGPGGHWRVAYPFVRLHQASAFYGVASTLLGGGRLQTEGPEAGLHERAHGAEIVAYYDRVLERLVASGSVELFAGCEHVGGRTFRSLETGDHHEVPASCRVVDARYLSPDVPAETPPPFPALDDARVVPVNDLVHLDGDPERYVVVGSGKTATDACIWLLQRGTEPDAITWVRPRDPWMLNRAVVQPDPVVFLGMVGTLMGAAAAAPTLPSFFTALEEAGIMLRLDPAVEPTMAKAPTLATWELDLLRSIEDVVRLGHVRAVRRGRLDLAEGSVDVADDAVVVHCAADGLKRPPAVPVWGPGTITLQPVRAGFPCLGAALIGYVEATRDDDEEKNRVCPPSRYGDSRAEWVRMNVVGARNAAAFNAEPDVKAWADGLALNPARVPPGYPPSEELDGVLARLRERAPAGLAGLDRLSGG